MLLSHRPVSDMHRLDFKLTHILRGRLLGGLDVMKPGLYQQLVFLDLGVLTAVYVHVLQRALAVNWDMSTLLVIN